MSSNAPNILFHHETPPPPGVWDAISARLDAEFDAQEIKIADKLYDWETPPPPGAWENIMQALPVIPSTTEAPAKVVRLPFRKVAIAAAILAIVGFLTWNFLNSTMSDPVVQHNQATPASNDPADNTNDITVQPSLPAIDASIGGRRRRTTFNVARRVNASTVLAANYVDRHVPEEVTDDIHYAGVQDLRAAATTSRNGIKAPPIKDANGNIILDYSLITSRDGNYITITCPNGEQARLSTKFLPLLTYLNAATEPAGYFDAIIRENDVWKDRFSQWRYKLMQQESFVPGATNFLDIMALKDLIEEN
ncbi:hypothetical protein HB364_24825 [Pseudoflavitalea sp. X16]|uniref:hypothetical protein n=1 Tax=Paraflavitalea devenefica TaxID=2716334 RepID=UPI00141DCEB7|nr:hypothetical protein [Paraflavitalea devenefica]NII28330.1 hypothetical protein [Paraflavitalea devenefica]